jgi:tetratricopeptide (TPR) repeat protein
MLAARANLGLERHAAAWDALRDGRDRFPEEPGFDREALLLLVDLQLYREAAEVGGRYLTARADEIEAWLAVAEAHRRAGNGREAAAILEEARLRFPGRVDVPMRLARTYLDLGEPGACGQVLHAAVPLDPALAAPAADCLRDAGHLERALYLNTMVPDPALKARQRLDLLIRAERWDQAVALTPRLARLGLVGEDAIAYALAYANFKLGRFDAAEASLVAIGDPRLFADATVLRRAMEECRGQPAGCL